MKFRGTCVFLLTALLLLPAGRGQERKEPGNDSSAEVRQTEEESASVQDADFIDDASDRPVLQGSSNVNPVVPPSPSARTAAGAEEQPAKRQPFTSVSTSKQFHVTGMDSLLAGAIATRADAIRTALLKVLKQPDEWKNGINIRLVGEPGSPVPANPVRMQTVIVGNTLSYSIFIHLGHGINQDSLRRAIVSTLLYEMMLRTVDPEGLPDNVTLPPWLIAGLEQAVLWHNNEADRAMYSTLFQQSGIMTPEEILNCREPSARTAAGAEEQPAKRQPFTSVSTSKQFHVTGMDSLLAGAIATRADAIRTALLKVLKQPDEWKNGINIRLVGEPGSPVPANPVRMQTVIVGNTLSYSIFIHLGHGINQDSLRRAIVSTLLYEMMLRTVDPEGLPDNVTLPPWLIAGLEQAVLWHNNEADRAMYSTLFQQSGIMTPEEILNCREPEKELDATSYAAYQTSCGALVLCLLNQENGPEGMKQLLDQAILGNDDPRNLIKRHFPQLSLTPTSLHKWWTLQLSRMATPPLTETLTITETERHLQEALTLVKYDPDTRTTVTFPLDDLEQARSLPDLNRQLSNVAGSLLNLSRRSFPSYRPVIVEYAKLVALMQTGKVNSREAVPKISQLREIRNLSMKTARRVRDYMDWYEINTRSGTGKTFASYAAAVKILREQEQPANTPVSRYLDDIEKLYTLPARAPVPSLHGKD